MNAPVKSPRLPIPQPRVQVGQPPRMPPVGRPYIASTGNGATAPVCPITQGQAAPAGPAVSVALPAPAVDLPSAIQAVNRLIQVANWLINPPTTNNFLLLPPMPVWKESDRKMVTTRVYSPNDASVWIDVQHIAMLEMTDVSTGQSMTLNYAAPKAGGVGTGPNGVVGGQTPGQ
jgi:hypothetical protein